jgi:hypothetical protein
MEWSTIMISVRKLLISLTLKKEPSNKLVGSSYRFTVLHMDVNKLPLTKSDFKSMLVITDKYSRYIWFKKLSRTSTGEILGALGTICEM